MTTPILESSLTNCPAWQALLQHKTVILGQTLSGMVGADPARLKYLSYRLQGLAVNAALSIVTAETLHLLCNLAEQRGVATWRDRMMAGEAVNTGEGRAALHTALRQQDNRPVMLDGQDILPMIRDEQKRQVDFVDAVRAGTRCGATGRPFRYVVSIGIGGSDLGPRMAVKAMAGYIKGMDVRFVANLDPAEFAGVTQGLPPEETLFILVSKTFTTQETVANAQLARQWLSERLGQQAVARHVVAVTVATEKAIEFGIAPENIFPIWDWIGGRFSLWSAVGLSLRLAIGNDHYAAMQAGAYAVDRHFCTTAFANNLPVLHALIGVWNRNFLELSTVAILPYSDHLRDVPSYLQQLIMESNGKSVTREGAAVSYPTAPVIFGERGTVSQHGFHQWLHQAPDRIACEFIGVRDPARTEDAVSHRALMANMAAQAWALALGHPDDNPALAHSGNRPSVTLMIDRLDPKNFGMLIAHYEHKTFVEAVIWGINPFDQPGVEFGKKLAREMQADKKATADNTLDPRRFYDSLMK